MTLKVILLKDVSGFGRRLEVKNVAEGYARNYLLPRKLAEIATKNSLKRLERFKADLQKEHDKLVSALKLKSEEIKNVVLEFKVMTGDKNEVFGSVSSKDIQIELRERGFDNLRIELERPFKTIGEHEIKVDFGEGIKSTLKIRVFGLSQ